MKISKKKILFISSTRADYSLQKATIGHFLDDKNISTSLIITGTHLLKKYGNTSEDILLKKNCKIIKLKINLTKDSYFDITNSFAEYVKKFNNILDKTKYDLVFLLGDRYEIFAAAISASINNVMIAHLHGGETTLGSKDNKFRNGISILSNYHFVSHKTYYNKLINIGCNSKNIFNYGPFCTDNLIRLKPINLIEIENIFNFKIKYKKYFIFTYHPETEYKDNEINKIKLILNVFKEYKNIFFIMTSANHDYSSIKINNFLTKFANLNKKNFKYIKSFGSEYYLPLVKKSCGVIGNSSSGLIEVPYFNKPTINIGNRQKGRFQFNSVINVNFKEIDLKNAINKVLNKKLILNNKSFYKKKVSYRTYLKIISIL